MEIVNIKIGDLKAYAQNPRKNDAAVKYVANSIREFGFKVPIVIDKNNVIVCGHTRLKAARQLRMATVPCVIADDLTEDQIKAFRLADNKTGEISEWDLELLAAELADINTDMLEFGFERLDLTGDKVVEDDPPDLNLEETATNPGDIYILGEHRLMCGDSISEVDVEKLMDGKTADMVLTDPPYNVDYEGSAGKIKNDNMGNEEFYRFLCAAFKNLYDKTKQGGTIYLCHADLYGLIFRSAMVDSGWVCRQCIIWVKSSLTLGHQDYQWQHEPILYGWKPGGSHNFYGDRKQTTTWEIPKPAKNAEHPTMKPLALCAKAIVNSSRENELVLDLFGGSGSTLMACEQLGRRCYMMELDPHYCDVIVKRWESLTGRKAERVRAEVP